ncbi:MAG: S1 RNA-binding domain-containing protein [Fusobacteriota bacterium]
MAIKKGDIVKGKVEKLTNFGAFVNLGNNRTGLVHISEVDSSYVEDISDFLKEGQKIKVKVLAIKDGGKIDLSIKAIKKKKKKKKITGSLNLESQKHDSGKFEDKITNFLKSSEERQNAINKRLNDRK